MSANNDYIFISDTYDNLSNIMYLLHNEDIRSVLPTGYTQTYYLRVYNEFVHLVATTNNNTVVFKINTGEYDEITKKINPNDQFPKSCKFPMFQVVSNAYQIIGIVEQYVRDIKSAKNLKLLGEIEATLQKVLINMKQ